MVVFQQGPADRQRDADGGDPLLIKGLEEEQAPSPK